MKRILSLILGIFSCTSLLTQDTAPAAKKPQEYLEMINRLTRIEKKLAETIETSSCDAVIDPELTRECQKLCRDLGVDETLFLNWESAQDTIGGTRAVCTGCNISQSLINLQAQVNSINSLLDQIEATLASVACTTGTCTLIPVSDFPKTISTGGSYCLKESTSTSGYVGDGSTPAIKITAEDVTLDLNGHTIFMGSDDVCVKVEEDRVTVKNGRIVRNSGQDGHAIHVQSTGASTVLYDLLFKDLILTGNSESGSGCGIYMEDVSRIVVDEITADLNADHGIEIEGTTNTDSGAGVVIQNSRMRANLGSGVTVTLATSGDDGDVIQNCIALSNGTYGFRIVNSTTPANQDVLLKSNIALANTNYGYSATNDDTHVQFVNNFGRGNGGAGGDPNYENVNAIYTPTGNLNAAPYWANISL